MSGLTGKIIGYMSPQRHQVLQGMLDPTLFDGPYQAGVDAALELVMACVADRLDGSITDDPNVVGPLIEESWTALQTEAMKIVHRVSAAEWLVLSRSVSPKLWRDNSDQAEFRTSIGARQAMLEALTAISLGPTRVLPDPLSRDLLASLLELMPFVGRLAGLWGAKQRLARRCRFSLRGDFPRVDTTPEEEEAFKLEDVRNGTDENLLSLAGAAMSRRHPNPNVESILLCGPTLEMDWRNLPFRLVNGSWEIGRIHASHGVTLLGVSQLCGVVAENHLAISQDAPSAIAMLYMLANQTESHPFQLMPLLEQGMLSVDPQGMMRSFLETAHLAAAMCEQLGLAPPSDINAVVNWGLRATGALVPRSVSPPLRRMGGMYLCDAVAASRGLLYAFSRGSPDGRVGNARGLAFQDQVQEAIDRSPWKPSADIKRLRGRTLKKQNGKDDMTDIDAIGQFGRVVLLVECRAKPPSPKYQLADPFSHRTFTDELLKEIKTWQGQVQHLRRYRTGPNYAFPEDSRVVGTYCTSSTLYVPWGCATADELPGLRAYCPLSEFRQWLHSGAAPPA